MDTISRTPSAADLSRTAVRPSVIINDSIGGVHEFSSLGRPSPRARRDFLPTLKSLSPEDMSATSLLRTSSSSRNNCSLKVRKEGQGLILLINKLKSSYFSRRHLLPWLVFILCWGYIGFLMQTRWAVWQDIQDSQARSEYSRSTLATPRGSSSRLALNRSEAGNLKLQSERREKLRLKGWSKDWLPQGNGSRAIAALHYVEQVDGHRDVTKPGRTGAGVIMKNGSSVGPFDEIEKQVLGPRRSSRRGTCSQEGLFPDFVRGKNFVIVFHELSMTGAPLAVFELASQIIKCGGKVSAVLLNKKGGLYEELVKQGIVILRDKFSSSWKAAARADLVVASSAACSTWIEQYLRYNKKGGEHLLWWLMENRREYFDRSKLLLGKARALVFLSNTQERLWQQWASNDSLTLPSIVEVVHLSVNDGLADIAGLDVSTERNGSTGKEVDMERETLRNRVRRQMGLESSDFLVTSLSSINPGKGQLLMLQAALMAVEGIDSDGGLPQVDRESLIETGSSGGSSRGDERIVGGDQKLRILLGSVGSKSNKPEYLEKIYGLLDSQPSLANILLWTEATVHVAPLYAAADAYVMNAQGIGETFGRVTIEAMAFGLPVLGTGAGGTKEIIESNITGLLHPTGESGIPVLARHLRLLLDHPHLGAKMGEKGKDRVRKMFREGPMYEALARIFIACVREGGG